MPNETIPTSGTPATDTNGRAASETILERATRILGGDIRPDDYLTLPPDAAAKVEWEFQTALAMRPGGILTDAEKHRIWQDRALSYHYGWRWVATLRTPDGVIALWVVSESTDLAHRLPDELQSQIHYAFPMPWE
jgi:hypothetical protein